MKFDFRFRRELERMKIQEVSFNGKRISAKSRPVSNVSDRIEALVVIPAANSRARNVDAVLGHELLVMRQIDCRDGIFRTISTSTPGSRENAERTRQQMPRPAYSPFGKQLADVAARNPLPAQSHLGIIMDLKSHFPPKFAQQFNVSRRLVPEVKVVAFVNFAGVQALLQNLMGKLVRRHQRKIAR